MKRRIEEGQRRWAELSGERAVADAIAEAHAQERQLRPPESRKERKAREKREFDQRAIERAVLVLVLIGLAYAFRAHPFALMHWVLAALAAAMGMLSWDVPTFVGWRAALLLCGMGTAVLAMAARAWGWALLFSFHDLYRHDASHGHIAVVMIGAFSLFMGLFAGLAGLAGPAASGRAAEAAGDDT